eukprot:TRINITY_DN1390_c0_g1_i1.p1 TRINITY_DN1390_c0_g1~~TRINITY_DN1390_c0_g1_i1.p1  ORF type:complete len:911 (+),score=232.44 TRINITY_DN1390_c0_g1_i1:102-2735(+)
MGMYTGLYPYRVLLITGIISIVCMSGLTRMDDYSETKSEKLWVPQDSVSFDDQDYIENAFGPDPWYARIMVINPEEEGANVLSQDTLLKLLELEQSVFSLVKIQGGVEYSLRGDANNPNAFRLCLPVYPEAADAYQSACNTRSVLTLFNYDAEYISSLDQDGILQVINNQAQQTTGLPIDAYVGGLLYADDGVTIVGAGALLTTYYLSADLTNQQIEACEAWQDDYLALVEDFDKRKEDCCHFRRFSQVTNEREVSRAASGSTSLVLISIGLIFVFTAFSFFKPSLVHSQMLLGLMGVAVILISVAAGFGLGLYFEIKFTPISQVIVFLTLGLGVANFIILGECYDKEPETLPIEQRNANALAHAGAFVTLTNGTTIIAFIVGSNSGFPAVHHFSLDAAIIITLNFLWDLTMWDALLVLSARRVKQNRMDMLFCIPVTPAAEQQSLLSADPHTREHAHQSQGPIDDGIRKILGPQVPKPAYKVFIMVLFSCLLGLGGWGISNLQEGLDLKDVVSDDSYYSEFYRLTSDFFDKYGPPLNIVIEEGVTYSNPFQRQELRDLAVDIRALPEVADLQPTYIFDFYEEFVRTSLNITLPENDEVGYFAYMDTFLNLQNPPGSGVRPFGALQYDATFERNGNGVIQRCISSRMRTYHVATLVKSAELIEALDGTRDVCAKYEDIPSFPFAVEYIVWDSFSEVRQECVQNLFISFLCVWAVLLLLLHPWAAFLVVFTIAMMDVLIMAWIPLFGLELNSVTVICIVMSVGIAVDYSCHIAHAFQVNDGTKSVRARKGVEDMGRAIISGAFATFLGILMLAFAPTAINRTFFTMMTGVIVVGCVHGILFLPVLLSLVGPRSFASNLHHGSAHNGQLGGVLDSPAIN